MENHANIIIASGNSLEEIFGKDITARAGSPTSGVQPRIWVAVGGDQKPWLQPLSGKHVKATSVQRMSQALGEFLAKRRGIV